ncbi:MAG: ATP-binding protein [Peptostreptococcaceae bacterium]|nr:ATP-binding protein [Peptostreptococcaceae bacterium]
MTLPCKPEYVGVVRLTVSAIANRMGFNIEEIEDIKVAVAEACTNAIKHGLDEEFDASFTIFADKMTISIKDRGKGVKIENIAEPDLSNPSENGGLGLFIIKSLMDDVDVISSIGRGTQITMTKFLGDDI